MQAVRRMNKNKSSKHHWASNKKRGKGKQIAYIYRPSSYRTEPTAHVLQNIIEVNNEV